MSLIGYLFDQEGKRDKQHEALLAYGCEKIFEDKATEENARPELSKAIEMLKEGDTLVIWKWDKVGETVEEITDFIKQLKDKGAQVKSLVDNLDTTTLLGRTFFSGMEALQAAFKQKN